MTDERQPEQHIDHGRNDASYPSAIDAWLVLVIGGAVCISLLQAWQLRHDATGGAVMAAITGAFILLIAGIFTLPCRYTLAADHLLIRCGVIRRRIPYSAITRVEPSSSLMSAPALSLRRLEVKHARGAQLISPRDRSAFIAALRERAPHVTSAA